MENKYSRLQISIHWLVFLLVIAAYCAMEFRGFFPRSDRPLINMIHVSCGISILVLMVVRLLLRLKYPTPPIIPKEGANKRGNSSRLTQSFHFFMFEPIFSPVNALNQPI
ncbi:cytochrome b/b6 domain-containing protein [Escherichia coli]|nr:cytochrome b/b6 domain-containing protein [Escherichia coli]